MKVSSQDQKNRQGYLFTITNQYCVGGPSQKSKGKKGIKRHKDQKDVKLFFADDMILYIENSEEYTNN